MEKKLKEFKEKNCKNCNKNIDCKIIKNIEGELVCVQEN
jgi:hypothetical protein|nr:MAG TPA_asm: hypothetical protein [Caudoviricetes sp.]